ncbi:MAG: MBOAT family protein [Planctomycetota bacterium]
MNFAQAEFAIFLFVVVAGTWLFRTPRPRHLWLLSASYYFYAHWDWRFCGLLMLSTAVDYRLALCIESSNNQRYRRGWLLCSIVSNLSVLGFFKYANFFRDTFADFLFRTGFVDEPSLGPAWQIILPVGVSFFTFQTLSYTVDVYRGKLAACRSVTKFALYVAFFPQLVAGPIVRAAQFLPQLEQVPTWNGRRFYAGLQQVLRGLVKKILVADWLADTVDVVFAGPDLYTPGTVILAVIAFAAQIYYDFSGYTDIAIGVAKILGYRFPVNFRHPYCATSIRDFWRRWHITLSRWLRDYVFVPLGGSRCGGWTTRRNLMTTMGLGGLWHGAAMPFVVWGCWHGMALVAFHMMKSVPAVVADGKTSQPRRSRLRSFLGWLATMMVVLIGWVLFRAPDMETAGLIFSTILGLGAIGTVGDSSLPAIAWYPPVTIGLLMVALAEHIVWASGGRRWMRLPADRWFSPVVTTVLIWLLLIASPAGYRPFVYFQF